ncbi:MAG TPA: ferritin-like domain-containing protein [Acidimicrobiia bacterium]|nr:ferritin-like domain-containing protein [Acidimicrobiia bacterium]
MDINHDELRRALRDLDQEHREVMPKWRDSLMRLLVDDQETPTEAKADLLLGGFNRRRFMRLGGLAAVGGVVLAACGDDKKKDASANGSTETTAAAATPTSEAGSGASKTDQTIARTAASLENFAVAVYDKAIQNAAALKISDPVAKAAVLFKSQHAEHASAFNAAATNLGGQPYTDPNPTAAKAFESTIAALKTEQDVLKLAFNLEQIAAETYQGVGMKLSTPMLRQTAMTVGGVEARHMAILGHFITPPTSVPAVAFQPIDKAVDSSFYV